MSASRREFIAGLAGTGIAAAIPKPAKASLTGPLYPPMNLSAFDLPLHKGDPFVRAGCSAITWSDNAKEAIQDISAAGFGGIQLRAPTMEQIPDPHALRDLLAEHKLTFVAMSSGNASLDPAVRRTQLETHTRHAHYVHEAGGLYMQILAGSAKPDQKFNMAECKLQGEIFNEIGKAAADFGVKLGFHNHMNTVGQPPEAVDAILNETDPNYLHLELDVAHYLQGGGDPAAAIRKYGHRILFMHFKDLRGPAGFEGYEFVEVGKGRVDFPAVFAALHAVNFRGWGIVELDRVPKGESLTPKEANASSLRYLREKFGVEA